MIADVTLPGMSGIDLARSLRQQHPAVKVLLATGHEPNDIAPMLDPSLDVAVVQKNWLGLMVDQIKAFLA